MTKMVAGIAMSPDGCLTRPNDGPGAGSERLRYWIFGGPPFTTHRRFRIATDRREVSGP